LQSSSCQDQVLKSHFICDLQDKQNSKNIFNANSQFFMLENTKYKNIFLNLQFTSCQDLVLKSHYICDLQESHALFCLPFQSWIIRCARAFHQLCLHLSNQPCKENEFFFLKYYKMDPDKSSTLVLITNPEFLLQRITNIWRLAFTIKAERTLPSKQGLFLLH